MSPPQTVDPVKVIISDDRLCAHVVVAPGDGHQPMPTLEDVLTRLAEARITFGIEPGHAQQAINQPGTPMLVAQGRASIDGLDGTVHFSSDLLSVGGRPKVTPDGDVDLFDLDLVHNVEPGAVLATITPPTPGQPGIDVSGNALRAHEGRAPRVVLGPGCQWSEDRTRVLAAVAGHATLVVDTVSVSQIYAVRGNVGPATGNIEFVGSVVVEGDVMQGYHLKAGGDVEVQGSVECGEVEAGGNVSVRLGIRGHAGHGRVSAAGTVRARFIEFAEVHAEASVYATDGVMCSVIQAGADVDVLGRHGSIIGGRIAAGHRVRVGELGSARGVETHVQVGSAPKLVAEAQALKDQLSEVLGRLHIVQERLASLQECARQGRLNEGGKRALRQYHDTYRTLLDQRGELLSHQPELLGRLRAARSASVSVRNICHAGVRVSISGMCCVVDRDWQAVRFKRDETACRVELTAA